MSEWPVKGTSRNNVKESLERALQSRGKQGQCIDTSLLSTLVSETLLHEGLCPRNTALNQTIDDSLSMTSFHSASLGAPPAIPMHGLQPLQEGSAIHGLRGSDEDANILTAL